MTRKVLVEIRALLALNGKCEKKNKNFLCNTNFNPYPLTECASEMLAVFFFSRELNFYRCIGLDPKLR